MKRIIGAIVLCLTLTGCATGQFGEFTRAVTTTINNPISDVDIYRVKNTYAAALELAVEYRRYCWSQPYAVLLTDPVARPLCERRRPVVRAIQKAQWRASAAIITATNFVRDNPTINAASAISAAWTAVSDFKNAVPAVR